MKESNGKIKVLAYIRYSSHAQDEGYSVPAQMTCIEEYAKAHNMEIEQYYIDMAKTGRNTNRPEYQRMKKDVESGKVKAKTILSRNIDRMHRKTRNQLIDVDWYDDYGIRFICITDYIDTAIKESRTLLTLKAAMAEEYSNTLSRTTRAGQLVAAQSCKHLGGTPPLGYKVNDEGTYEIDESTAPIIRDIFKLYLQNMGYNNIIKYLKNKGHKTANGNDFSKASLNAILRNQKYMGTYTFDRTAPMNSEGKRNSHKVKEKYTVIENGMPAIISAEDFAKVKAKMAENAGKHSQRASSNYYALNGKIKCADCGKAISGNVNHSKGKKYLQYRCTCGCKHRSISVKRLNDMIFYALQQCLFSHDNRDKIVKFMNNQLQLKANQRSVDLAAIKDKIDRLNNAQNNLIALLEAGRATDVIMTKIEKNAAELTALTAQLEASTKEISEVDNDTYNELIKRFVEYMGTNMTPQAIDLKNAAIDRIEIGSDKTTIHFNHGIGIDLETREYFDNEKNWEAAS